MNYEKNISPDNEVKLDFEIPLDELGSVFKDLLRDFQRDAKVPGFRPGKIPMSLIRQRWGRDLQAEKATEIARERLIKVIDDEKLAPGGRIDIDLVEYGEDLPLRFNVTFPLRPEVNLAAYKGLKVSADYAEVTDDDLDKQIEALRKKNATLRSIDTSAPVNAKVGIKYQEVDPSGLPLIGREVEEMTIEFGSDSLGIGSDEQLMGIKAGETRLVRVKHNPAELSQAPVQSKIITPDQAQTGQTQVNEKTLSVEAIKVEVPELPDIDEDFVKTVNEKLETVDELRAWIKSSLVEYVERDHNGHVENHVIEKLIAENEFPIARSYTMGIIDRITEGMGEDEEKREEFVKEHFDSVEREQRWIMLRDEIAKAEKVEITDDDVEFELKKAAELSGKTVEDIRKELGDQDSVDRLKSQLFERKVIEILVSNAEVEKRIVSLDDFFKHQH